MLCPYCGKEMKTGLIHGDGRGSIYWKEGTKNKTFTEWLGGSGKITAVKHKWTFFRIESHFCSQCRKMIIETDVSR